MKKILSIALLVIFSVNCVSTNNVGQLCCGLYTDEKEISSKNEDLEKKEATSSLVKKAMGDAKKIFLNVVAPIACIVTPVAGTLLLKKYINRDNKYQKKSKHFVLNVNNNDLEGKITSPNLKRWLNHLDNYYEECCKFVGIPCDKKITIFPVDNGWTEIDYDNSTIKWDSGTMFKSLKSINDQDSWCFGVTHEIGKYVGHLIKDKCPLTFDIDFFSNLFKNYISSKENVIIPKWEVSPHIFGAYSEDPSTIFDKKNISEIYRSVTGGCYDEKLGNKDKVEYSDDSMVHIILQFVKKYGWDFIKKACCESPCSISSISSIEKFYVTMDSLKKQCKEDEECLNDLNNLFKNSQLNAINQTLN